ncbi:MAG: putative porin [Thermodesulfobacteriota bacterium]
MRKVLLSTVALGLCLLLPGMALAGAGASAAITNEQILRELENNKKIMQELEYLRMKVASQQEHIEDLKSKVEKKGDVSLANEAIDGLKLKGDLRTRYEIRDRDYKDSSGRTDIARDRWRTRIRVGGIWDNKVENWQVGAGVASGSNEPTSTNDTWSQTSPFEHTDINIDYAYAKHKWEDFTFTLGQHENPYKSSWVFWDGDVRLAGLTGQFGKKDGLFATLGGYGAKLVNDDNTSTLVAGQLGYKGKAGEVKYTVAGGYHTYSTSMINEDAALGANAALGLGSVNPDQYELNIGDLYGDVTVPVGPANVTFYGQIWQNFGADGVVGQSQAGSSFPHAPDDADMGYVIGADAKIDKFKLGYAYSLVEADSLFGYLSDSDFGDGLSRTNKRGHRVQLGYSFTKNWSADLSWLNFERDEDWASAREDQVDIYQFDVNYKF